MIYRGANSRASTPSDTTAANSTGSNGSNRNTRPPIAPIREGADGDGKSFCMTVSVAQ